MLLADDPRFRPAMKLIDDAKYREAIAQLDALEKLSSGEQVVALFWKARCLTSLREIDQAKLCLEEALKQVEDNSPLRICLQLQSAYLLYTTEGPDQAVLQIRALLDRHATDLNTPELFWIHVQAKTDLGNCLVLARRYSEAAQELGEALSLQDQPLSRYFICFWLGLAFEYLEDLPKAKTHFERALTEAQSAPKAGVSHYDIARLRYELAQIAYRNGRFDDARHELEEASAQQIVDAQLLNVIERLKGVIDRASH